jgi:hypothetical protein
MLKRTTNDMILEKEMDFWVGGWIGGVLTNILTSASLYAIISPDTCDGSTRSRISVAPALIINTGLTPGAYSSRSAERLLRNIVWPADIPTELPRLMRRLTTASAVALSLLGTSSWTAITGCSGGVNWVSTRFTCGWGGRRGTDDLECHPSAYVGDDLIPD